MSEARAGIIGFPIKHSLSPVLHRGWLQDLGIPGSYEALEVPSHELGAVLNRWRREGWRGGNVTIPHKVAILNYLDEVDETALAIGAVNTLTIEKGMVRGLNTDAQGFIAHLARNHRGWLDLVRHRHVLVLGAGGAARAIVYSLARAGARHLQIANRSQARTAVLMKDLGALARLEPIRWEDRDQAISGARLIVNATSLGMAGEPALTLDLSKAAPGTIVADMVYNPLETPLLKAAKARGLPVLDGLGILVEQARPGFRIWFGAEPPFNGATRERLIEALKKP